jgi:hypothetical protein
LWPQLRSDKRVGQQVRSVLTRTQEIEVLQQECATAQNWSGNNYLPLLWRHYKNTRPVLFRAVNVLKPGSMTEENALLKAWNVLCEKSNRRTDYLPVEDVPLDFASKRWRDLLRHPTDPKKMDRRQLEICVLSCLTEHLQSGTVFVPGSGAFADHRAALLPWRECERRLKEYCDRIGLPATADEFIEEMQRRMTEVANRVDRQFPQNTAVTINAKGVPVLNKYNARVIPESAQRLHVEVIRRMPERSILDILVNVEHLTNFTKHFGPAATAMCRACLHHGLTLV